MLPVKAKRYELRLTITQAAAKAGLARQTIRQMESGSTPQAPTAMALADAYGCKVTDLWPSLSTEPACDCDPKKAA